MINKNNWWNKLTVATINKTFGVVVFVLVFLFTFLITASELKEHWVIILAVFGGVIGLVGIAWAVLAYLVYKKKKANDPNQQKIEQALKSVEDKQEEVNN